MPRLEYISRWLKQYIASGTPSSRYGLDADTNISILKTLKNLRAKALGVFYLKNVF